jgi:hypothetical protein
VVIVCAGALAVVAVNVPSVFEVTTKVTVAIAQSFLAMWY